MNVKRITLCSGLVKWVLCLGQESNSIWICYGLNISHQKLSAVARKHQGKFIKRHMDYSKYVAFSKEENARAAADELDALIIAKKLGI